MERTKTAKKKDDGLGGQFLDAAMEAKRKIDDIKKSVYTPQGTEAEMIESAKEAFKIFDTGEDDSMDDVQCRMALRYLGFDTPVSVVRGWLDETDGSINGEQFLALVQSGKPGLPILRVVQLRDNSLGKDRIKLARKDGRRVAYNEDLGGRGFCDTDVFSLAELKAHPLGTGGQKLDLLTPERRSELSEAFLYFDSDRSGFLDCTEVRSALRGLGFDFDDVAIIRACERVGGYVGLHDWELMGSSQLFFRDQRLKLFKILVGLEEKEIKQVDEEQNKLKALEQRELSRRKHMMELAKVHLRTNSFTDEESRWLNPFLTTHRHVGRFSLALQLYFDMVCVFGIGFVLMAAIQMPLLSACINGRGNPVLSRVPLELQPIAQASIVNLDKVSNEDALAFISADAMAVTLFFFLIMLYRTFCVPLAIWQQGPYRHQDLAVLVTNLPRDLEEHHHDYAKKLSEHFTEIVTRNDKDEGLEAEDKEENPVREIVLIRDYHGDLYGVLEQVNVQKKERSLAVEMEFWAEKALLLPPELFDENSEIRRRVNKSHAERKADSDKLPSESGSAGHGRESRNPTNSKKTPEEIKKAKVLAKRAKSYDKQYNKLVRQREQCEEKVLDRETERSSHADMTMEERDVLGAYVTFWSERARDDVLRLYGFSSSRIGRCCCKQKAWLKFNPDRGEKLSDDDGAAGATTIGDDDDDDDLEDVYTLCVDYAVEPSLIKWQNIDYPPIFACLRWVRRRIEDLLAYMCMFLIATALLIGHAFPFVLPLDLNLLGVDPLQMDLRAAVWVIGQVSNPSGGSCWNVCEIALSDNAKCSSPRKPNSFVSSNFLHPVEDPGLAFVSDFNYAGGAVCRRSWSPKNCWEPLNVSGLHCTEARQTPVKTFVQPDVSEDINFVKETWSSLGRKPIPELSGGGITQAEFEGVIQELYVLLDDARLQRLFAALDVDQNSMITSAEFFGASDTPYPTAAPTYQYPPDIMTGDVFLVIDNCTAFLVEPEYKDAVRSGIAARIGLSNSLLTLTYYDCGILERRLQQREGAATRLLQGLTPSPTLAPTNSFLAQVTWRAVLPVYITVKSAAVFTLFNVTDASVLLQATLLAACQKRNITSAWAISSVGYPHLEGTPSFAPTMRPTTLNPTTAPTARRALAESNPSASPTLPLHEVSTQVPTLGDDTVREIEVQAVGEDDQDLEPEFEGFDQEPDHVVEYRRAAAAADPQVKPGWGAWTGCYWAQEPSGLYNTSVVTVSFTYQANPTKHRTGHTALIDAVATALVRTATNTPQTQISNSLLASSLSAKTFYLSPQQVYGGSVPAPGMCVDQPDAVSQLFDFMRVVSSDAAAIKTCRDLGHYGFLGPQSDCKHLPAAWRSMCPFTCQCPCSSKSLEVRMTTPSDCDPTDGNWNQFPGTKVGTPGFAEVGLWNANTTFVVLEGFLEICVDSGDVLSALKCGAGYARLPLFNDQISALQSIGVYPIEVRVGTPQLGRKCVQAPRCPLDQILCRSRLYDSICATLCDGVEECVDGVDELCGSDCSNDGIDNGTKVEQVCQNPPTRCIDIDTDASICGECADGVMLYDVRLGIVKGSRGSKSKLSCSLNYVTQGRLNSSAPPIPQCDMASLQPAFQAFPMCDPASDTYNPCLCLKNTRLPSVRAKFGCLVRGDLAAALKKHSYIQVYYPLDTLAARRTPNAVMGLGGNAPYELICMMLERGMFMNASACSLTEAGVQVVCNSAASFEYKSKDAPYWLETSDEYPASVGKVNGCFELWIKTKCTLCAVAQFHDRGVFYIDAEGRAAVKYSAAELTKGLAGGPPVADDNWHFVAHSIGPDGGETLFVDGLVVAKRTLDAAVAAGWTPSSSQIIIGFSTWMRMLSGVYELDPYFGLVDEVALFGKEIAEEDMTLHYLSASRRADGPTFAKRFLADPCLDARRVATSGLQNCPPEVNAAMQRALGCQYGDPCRCKHDMIRWMTAAGVADCKLSCNSFDRSLTSLLTEKCEDDNVLFRACTSDANCNFVGVAGASNNFYYCNKLNFRCEVSAAFLPAKQWATTSVSLCIARNMSMVDLALPQYRPKALHILAGFMRMNVSNILDVQITPGCPSHQTLDMRDNPMLGLMAHSGNKPYEFQGLLFGPNRSKTEMVINDDGVVSNAGGFTHFTFPYSKDDSEVARSYIPQLPLVFGRVSQWTDEDPQTTDLSALDPTLVPNLTVRIGNTKLGDIPPLGSGLMSYALPFGSTHMQTSVLKPVTCAPDVQFQCEPNVCIDCTGGRCVCDGIVQCESRLDENLTMVNATSDAAKWCQDPARYINKESPCTGNGTNCIAKGKSNMVCVGEASLCDSVQDCEGGEDEVLCPELHPDRVRIVNWVGGLFYDETTGVACVQVTQPVHNYVDRMRIYMCDLAALVHPTGETHLNDVAEACRYAGEIKKNVNETLGTPSRPSLLESSSADSITFQTILSAPKCALGAKVAIEETIGFAAAKIAYSARGSDDPLVLCFCEQRLQFQPEIYLSLPSTHEKYIMCKRGIDIKYNQKLMILVRIIVLLLLNEFFTFTIGRQIATTRHKTYVKMIKDHFKTLTTRLLISMIFFPWLFNMFITVRTYHATIGVTLGFIQFTRMFWPHALRAIMMPVRNMKRRIQIRHAFSQEVMNDIYTNPEFVLGEAYAQMCTTCIFAIIFAPVMPVLTIFAAISMFARYFCDWFVVLWGSAKPPAYDEQIAYNCLNYALFGLTARCFCSMVVFADSNWFSFPPASTCAYGADDVMKWREDEGRMMFDAIPQLLRSGSCSDRWWSHFVVGFMCMTPMYILPCCPSMQTCLRKCCKKRTGKFFDEVAKLRSDRGMLSSYEPRQSKTYQAAFKLLDLAARNEETIDVADSDSSSEGEESEGHPESDHEEWAPRKGWGAYTKPGDENNEQDADKKAIEMDFSTSAAKSAKKKEKKEKKETAALEDDPGNSEKKSKKDHKEEKEHKEKKEKKDKGLSLDEVKLDPASPSSARSEDASSPVGHRKRSNSRDARSSIKSVSSQRSKATKSTDITTFGKDHKEHKEKKEKKEKSEKSDA